MNKHRIVCIIFGLVLANFAHAKSESEITFQTDQKYSYSEKEVNDFKVRFWTAVKSRNLKEFPDIQVLAMKKTGASSISELGASADFLDDLRIKSIQISRGDNVILNMGKLRLKVSSSQQEILAVFQQYRSGYLEVLVEQYKLAKLYLGYSLGCDSSLSFSKCLQGFRTLNELIHSNANYVRRDLKFYDEKLGASTPTQCRLVDYSVPINQLASQLIEEKP